METVVIDSGIAVKWYTEEADSNIARRVLADYEQGAISFRAPGLIYAEFGNIVWKKQRFQGIPQDAALTALSDFQTVSLLVTPDADLIEDALRLAVTHGRSVYDCLYLALSVRENCRFVTADEKLVNAVGATLLSVTWLARWP